MRRGAIPAVAVLSLYSLASCAPAETGAARVDVAAEAQAIRDLSTQWMASLQAKDAESVTVYADNAATLFDGTKLQGVSAILSDMRADFAENPAATIRWTISSVDVAASGDMAIERGDWFEDPDGAGPLGESHGEYMTYWRKMGDGPWRVVFDAGSTIADPVAPEDDGVPEGAEL